MQKVSIRHWAILIILVFFVITLGAVSQPARKESVQSSPSTPLPEQSKNGYVLRADEGEALQRGKGNTVTVKVDPKTGSPGMAMGTQVLAPSVGIPIHMHEHEDEVLYVNDGDGVAILNEQRKAIGKGDTVYIPHGIWHGVETHDAGISLLWIVTPPGLEGFFREISTPPGGAPKVLTPAQIEDIGRKHGVRFKRR